ncbi:hypothetical protein [Conexibacter sp. CPCC 206217]|uniref:hypothetical protein n=1 Tax=Conexibacter sp. CPCC 206217 TaxID=3064574 RepID=UPI0027184A0B|nr:hypothetical protein [Conexibacter sp. CPCC 206217]MDO8210262.1 hypothetical protein [Conexibacter sp. CPCC 206217]
MRPTEPKDMMVMVAIAAVVGLIVVNAMAGEVLDAAVELARSPLVPVLAGVLVAGLVAVLLVRRVLERRVLADRVRLELVPADSFAPEIRSAARRSTGGLLAKRAHAVRIRLDTDPDGRLRYSVELPRHARRALEVGVGSYGGVELRELPAPTPAPARPAAPSPTPAVAPPAPHSTAAPHDSTQEDAMPHVARAELVLARDSRHPLLETGVDPDPLAGFAQALEPLIPRDEQAEVCVDLLPLTPSERRRLRSRLMRKAQREERRGQKTLGEMLRGEPAHRTPPTRAELVERRAEHRALAGKLGDPLPLFRVQVLVRASSPLAGRAVEQVAALVAAFRAFDGENHFRVVGQRDPLGFAGADAPWRRGRFDARVAGGLFAPARKRLVNAEEIAGLLKPPTKSCESENVVRSGGRIPAPPRGLPTFDHQPGLLPLGRVVSAREGERLVGVPLEGSYFMYVAGRSRFGKTDRDRPVPAPRAQRARLLLPRPPRRRAGEDQTPPRRPDGARHRAEPHRPPRRTADRLQRVDAIVDAFASTMRWDEVNARAINLTAQAAHALAAKLARYATLYHHTLPPTGPTDRPRPLWTHRYTIFPAVLLVLTGRDRPALERRRTAIALCGTTPQLTDTPAVRIAACLLADLVDHGPFAPILTTAHDPARPAGWLDR